MLVSARLVRCEIVFLVLARLTQLNQIREVLNPSLREAKSPLK